MLYTCLNDVWIRMTLIGKKLSEATLSGKHPLPKEFADLDREWRELNDLYWNHRKHPALSKGGVEVVEAIMEDCHEFKKS